MNNLEKTMDKIVALCKNRGFIFPGSEIYGGLANSWDYGPLGVEFKNNVKRAWWKKFVQESRYNVGLDSAIIMNPEAWVASPILSWTARPARHVTVRTSSLRSTLSRMALRTIPQAGPLSRCPLTFRRRALCAPPAASRISLPSRNST